jgi:hypothetical protein
MLTKNIYLLYPAGYSGNYVSWAISASDADLRLTTVKNPINSATSRHLGGNGTSHLHERIPTHQAIQDHLIWIAYNRPKDFKIYVIFTTTDTMSSTLGYICRIDPDPLFIVIHDNSDTDIRTYGNINSIKKWPTYLHTLQIMHNFYNKTRPNAITNYDFFNCPDDQLMRNSIAKKQLTGLVKLDPLTHATKTQYSDEIYRSKLWYQTRSQLQPHELPLTVHLIRDELPEQQIYQLSCLDVASPGFPGILQNILKHSGCCTEFDISPVEQVHDEYISAQENLAWFESIKHWRQTGELDAYLTSHAVIQGFVIQQIFDQLGYQHYVPQNPHNNWKYWYNTIRGVRWPDCDVESDFVNLPTEIQQEMIVKFNYQVDPNQLKKNIMLHELENWETMTIEQINDVFCRHWHSKNT